MTNATQNSLDAKWDTSSSDQFYDYYAELNSRKSTMERFRVLRDSLLTTYRHYNGTAPVDVLDVGCNSGPLTRVWAEKGFRLSGVDINERLIKLARKWAEEDGFDIDFRLGSATDLPFEDESFDLCCVPELLEHVEDWQACLSEAVRVLRPSGMAFLSTTNWLCPVQHEYNLPLYSWYPPFAKRYYERLAFTTKPELANYATYPAIHWFSPYRLKRFVHAMNMDCLDRFDAAAINNNTGMSGLVLKLICRIPGLKLLGHIVTDYTSIIIYKPPL